MPVLQRTVPIDRKRDSTVHGSRRASSGIYRPLLPVAVDSVLHRFDVPAIASSEISSALALNGNAARTATGSFRITGREIGVATFAVRDIVVLKRGLIFECPGLTRWG